MRRSIEPPLPGHRRMRGYAAAILAVLTCPCHLPLLLVLLSGTVAGGLLSAHVGGALALFALLFLLFLVIAWRALRDRAEN
ncbi:mercury resistance protein [Paraburkholderia fungorum]|uniref:Mercuric ion transport protein n=1 Tax=Paraburkholderia fungorum TaxID=134537 RepID=A0AAW3V0S6_9BURK|nr:mercury resistance protein [Paraburkholderia fungorum]MBB4517489.1 mercuric ion transport protein [Paraburkholderia fungorum]MBB6204557.1 mercuric ion transport protein [Paraburkholderia fungorum]